MKSMMLLSKTMAMIYEMLSETEEEASETEDNVKSIQSSRIYSLIRKLTGIKMLNGIYIYSNSMVLALLLLLV